MKSDKNRPFNLHTSLNEVRAVVHYGAGVELAQLFETDMQKLKENNLKCIRMSEVKPNHFISNFLIISQ